MTPDPNHVVLTIPGNTGMAAAGGGFMNDNIALTTQYNILAPTLAQFRQSLSLPLCIELIE